MRTTALGDAPHGRNARGGNDTLIGGANGETTGSTATPSRPISENARGGNDTLISGTGIDHMWGDALFINGVAASPTAPTGTVVTGADTFVFAPATETMTSTTSARAITTRST